MKKTISIVITGFCLLSSLIAQKSGQEHEISSCPGVPTVTDHDGNIYNTVQIGRQCWMRENLRVTNYSNGDPIMTGLNNNAWETTTDGAYSIFDINYWAAYGIDSEEEMVEAYGKLYNWYAVNDPRGLCPPGMHIPSLAEWQQLIAYVEGEDNIKGNKLKSCRQHESPLGDTCDTDVHPYWLDHDTHYGSDNYGFSGLPAGHRDTDGSYNGLTTKGYWWSSGQHDDLFAWYMQLEWRFGNATIIGYNKTQGLSIRCLNNLVVPSVTTDETTVSSALKVIGGGEVLDPGITDVTARGVVWGKDLYPDLDNNEGVTVNGDGLGMFLSEITDFEYNTTYYVRAYATNSEGTGYGNQVTFYVTTNSPCQDIPTVTDIDGNVYNTVQIGDQCWLKENLKTTQYRNGVSITYPGENNTLWQNNTDGAYAWYDNDLTNKDKYGALYNWHAVNNPNGLCPVGWRVATHQDWTNLTNFIGGMGSPFGNHLKSCRQDESPLGGDCDTQVHPRWNKSSVIYGTDIHGFSALPGGLRQSSGSYDFMGSSGSWWTSTLSSDESAWTRQLSHQNDQVYQYGPGSFDAGIGVRCIRESDTEPQIPNTREIEGQNIEDSHTECFDALQTITVSDFTVQPGGSTTFIAGQSIHLLPGVTVMHGGYLLARIAANENDFCGTAKASEIKEEPCNLKENLVSVDPPKIIPDNYFFKVYPNPTTGEIILELDDFEQHHVVIAEIYGMHGHLITRNELPAQKEHTLSLVHQQPGIYLLRVLHNNKTGGVKIIKR